MSWWQVIVLAVVQGLTEFLPVSSSGHLAIVSRIFFADDAGASFTAVFASGLFSIPDAFHPVTSGMSATGLRLVVATLIAFVIGLAAVPWLLRFLVRHSMYWFVGYRVLIGGAVLTLLASGTVCAT